MEIVDSNLILDLKIIIPIENFESEKKNEN